MSTQSVPPTFKAWQFNSARGGLEKNLALNPSAPEIKQRAKQHLVQVIAVSLNPVDHKIVEIPFVLSLLNTPATPGFDFAGRIVQPADGSSLQPGQYVFGSAAAPPIGGALAEYAAVDAKATALLPEGVSPIHGASVPIAGVSAYQSIVPFIKEGSNVFINGGSGGTGTFGIQIAKAMGCHVTTSCSTPNVQLCKELGADEVIDYKKGSVLQALISSGRKYDHVVDNVGSDYNLYWKCHEYTVPGAVYEQVGAHLSLRTTWDMIASRLWPGFLGGGKRKISILFAEPNTKDLTQIAQWISTGQVKCLIDSEFEFENVPEAYRRLKTGRARGKVVVHVSKEASN